MANANPSSPGKANIPSEANSKGSLNESLSEDEKAPSKPPKDKRKLSKKPKRGERGEYRPSHYKTPRGNVRTDR